eukprot:528507_1
MCSNSDKICHWIFLFIGIVFIASQVYNVVVIWPLFWPDVAMGRWDAYPCKGFYNTMDVFIVLLNIFIVIPIIIFNIYHLCKLYEQIHVSSPNKSCNIIVVIKSFIKICTVFLISWIISYSQQTYVLIYELECFWSMMDMFVAVPTFFGIFTITVIGIECSKWKQSFMLYSAQSFISSHPNIVHEYGLSFILFNLKWYALGIAAVSTNSFTWYCLFYQPWNDNDWHTPPRYAWPTFILDGAGSILGTVLWFQCHSFSRKLLSYHIYYVNDSVEKYELENNDSA